MGIAFVCPNRSEREINRGDRGVWGIDSDGNVGLLNSGRVNARFAYDIVFPEVGPTD